MALTFLRQHFKRNAPKLPPQNQHPPPPQIHVPTPLLHPPPSPPLDFSSNQEPSLTDDASIGSEALSDGERSVENTPPPGGEQDSGICADSGSNFSQQESSTSPMDKDPESDEIDTTTADAELNQFPTELELHGHIEGPTSDYPVNEDILCNDFTQSSDNFERFHASRDSVDADEYSTGTLTSSADSQDILAVTNESPSSRCVPETSGEEQDTDTNASPSPGDDIGELDMKPPSSEELEDENKTSLSEIQSPHIPPPPPLPGLRFMGEHTTSSTTDSTSFTSKQISTTGETDLGGDKNKNLVDEIRAAAGQHLRKMSNSMELCSVPTSKRLSETINEDIKAVIVARQMKLEQSEVDFETRLPQAKATFYQARIGVAPEDTELGRLFRKRAEKLLAQSPVESRTDFDAGQPVDRGDDEQPRTSEVSSSMSQGYRSEYGEKLEATIDETPEDDIDSDDDTIQQLSVHEVEDGDALSESTEDPSRNQEIQPLHDKSDSETQDEQNQDDLDAVVKDLDQLLLDNSSSSNLVLPTDNPSIPSPSSSSGYFEMASGCPSPSDSPELSPTSFGSENAFDDVDDDVITSSKEIVREHSKLLSQPLESYNILPGVVSETENPGPERSFTFKNLMRSFRKAFGAPTTAVLGKKDPVVTTADGKLEFDDNWSIHDTIRDKEKVTSRSLQDVFDAPREVRSLSEFVDSTRDSGKDFSVRNWQDVLDKSSNGGSTGSPEDQAGDALVFLGIRSTGKPKKSSKSKTTEVLDDISSDLSGTGSQRLRLASSGLNSTIPSRRNHVIIQSLDSIFPVSHQAGQRHYQKQHYSMSAVASNALLSPVVRRQQRNQKK